ncbi:MAG: prephenate dehydrogenase [Sulfurovum sp.]|nr:prephenate dehydrogenase [Sulfurovum sp.]
MRIGIIGLGLMGGSLGIAAKRAYSDVEVIGFDHNDQHCTEALEYGIVDKIIDDIGDFFGVDMLFLAIPVDGIIEILKNLSKVAEKTTIIDLGSTKEKIISVVPPTIRQNFIAAHPMTGTEKSGPSAAIDGLYHGKAVVLCDLKDSGEKQQNMAKNFFAKIGMKIFYMEAKEHDKHAAYISHMPHALSYALANSVMKQENPKAIIALAGGGFKDMSRIAKSSPNMWRDVFHQNKEYLLDGIECFSEELDMCKKFVEEESWEELHQWMTKANDLHKIL